MKIKDSCICLGIDVTDKEEAIRLVGNLLFAEGYVENSYVTAMIQREHDLTTYIGNGIAIPHGTESSKKWVKEAGLSVVQFPNGVDFGDGNIAYIVFGIAARNNEHLDLLSQIAIFCSDKENVNKLKKAQTKESFLSYLQEEKP